MRITFLVDSLGNPGGMERVLSTKANYFAEKLDYKVTIIVKLSIPKELFFEFSPSIEIVSLEFTRGIKYNVLSSYNSKHKKKVSDYLMKSKQDIVIGLFGSELPFLYRINDGSKKIQEFHFSKNYLIHLVENIPNLRLRKLRKAKAYLKQKKEQFYAKKYNCVVLLTEKDQRLWGNKIKSYVIPNPVSFVSHKKSELTNKKIVAIGRLIAQKGFDDLITAFSNIHHKIKGWELEIYGEGQDLTYLNSIISKHELHNKIKILPPVKNIKSVLTDSSIFVFPSNYEGFGLVLTEAMECGLPVIAYDCECGPSEIVKHGEDGYLVPVGDIDSLSERIKELANSEELRKDLTKKGIINVKRFYPEEVMTNWLNLFETLNKKD